MISSTPDTVPSNSSLVINPASRQKDSKLRLIIQNHMPNTPKNQDSATNEVSSLPPPSVSSRAVLESLPRFNDVRNADVAGRTAATDMMPNDRNRCFGVRRDTDARLAKATDDEASM